MSAKSIRKPPEERAPTRLEALDEMEEQMMPQLPDKITWGDKYGAAMKITDPDEAKSYFEACVEHCMRFGNSREEAENIERSNIGYYAGYYDNETAERMYRLFGAVHPIFGRSWPSPEEAFEMGRKFAGG